MRFLGMTKKKALAICRKKVYSFAILLEKMVAVALLIYIPHRIDRFNHIEIRYMASLRTDEGLGTKLMKVSLRHWTRMCY